MGGCAHGQQSGRALFTWRATSGVYSLAWQPEANAASLLVAGLDDGSLQFFNPADAMSSAADVAPTETLPAHQGAVLSLTFDPTSRVLISGADDFMLRRWRMPATRGRVHRAQRNRNT